MRSALLLFLLASVLCSGPVLATPPAGPRLRGESPSGSDSKRVDHVVVRTPGGVDVHVLRLSLDQVELRLLTPPPGEQGARVSAMGAASGAILAVNASYFLDDYTPLGLLISGGRVLQKPRKVDWGVFFVRDRRASLVHVRDVTETKGMEFAVQAGPRLVVDGRPTKLKPQRARRTMIGVDARGRVLIAVSAMPLLLSEAADFLIAQGAVAALNLDGGPSSQLYYPEAGVALESFSPVANAIGVFPRAR